MSALLRAVVDSLIDGNEGRNVITVVVDASIRKENRL